jgi:hypothetical protein
MPYFPRPTPRADAQELSTWVGEELRNVARAFQESEQTQYTVLHVAPDRPREGIVVRADGTDWNPGGGAGFYGYVSGAWVKFAAGAAPTPYSEGTFTPAIRFGGNAVGLTYNSAVGTYVKVGKLVTVHAFISILSNGTSTGNATIISLPFTCGARDALLQITGHAFGNGGGILNVIYGRMPLGGTIVNIETMFDGDIEAYNETYLIDGAQVFLSGSYIASA